MRQIIIFIVLIFISGCATKQDIRYGVMNLNQEIYNKFTHIINNHKILNDTNNKLNLNLKKLTRQINDYENNMLYMQQIANIKQAKYTTNMLNKQNEFFALLYNSLDENNEKVNKFILNQKKENEQAKLKELESYNMSYQNLKLYSQTKSSEISQEIKALEEIIKLSHNQSNKKMEIEIKKLQNELHRTRVKFKIQTNNYNNYINQININSDNASNELTLPSS